MFALLAVGLCWGAARPSEAEEARAQGGLVRGAAPLALGPGSSAPPRAKVGPIPPPPLPPVPPGTFVSAARSSEHAGTLARRLGLTYEDGGAFVLLADDICRVRVYPGTHVISLDGQEQTLRGLMQREMQGVLIPGPAVGIIERHVFEARARFRAALAVEEPKPAPAALAPKPARTTPPTAPSPIKPVLAPAVAAPQGTVMPDPHWVVAPTARAWKWIVLHHSDDQSGCMAKYHQVHLDKGWENGCGYHFVIGNGSQSGDGEVEPSRRWLLQQQGAHAKTPDNAFNDHGIGICLVGDFEHGSGRPTAGQMRALKRLVQWLMDRYEIRLANVRGHCHCGATCCPGKNFPWDELRGGLRDPARAGLAQARPVAPPRSPTSTRPEAGSPVAAAAGRPAPAPAAVPPSPGLAAAVPAVPLTAPAAKSQDLGAPPAGPSAPLPQPTR